MPNPANTPDPADLYGQQLSKLAYNTRVTTAVYGNVRGNPGSSVRPARLLSDIGFPLSTEVTYIIPAFALLMAHDPPRAVTQIVLHPFGLDDDVRRLTASRPADRIIRSSAGPTGVRTYPGDNTLLISGSLDDDTYSDSKNAALVGAMTSAQQGPAYHYVIGRDGTLLICAPLDSQVSTETNGETNIDIALEGAFAIQRSDFDAKNFFGKLIELPYTALQLFVLAVLIVKLRTAYQGVSADFTSTGISYDWEALPNVQLNYSNGAWRSSASPFDHSFSDQASLLATMKVIPPFDLATQIFVVDQAPPPRATRAVAQTAIGQVDTVGAQSVMLANYGALASPERSNDMQTASRVAFFVERSNSANADADNTSGAAAEVAATSGDPTTVAATEVGPATYDFATGFWGDSTPSTY